MLPPGSGYSPDYFYIYYQMKSPNLINSKQIKNQLLLAIGLLFALHFPLQAQLLHDYELNGDYLDAFGGNPMVPNGGFLNATEYVFGPDQGPNVSGVIDPGTYCIQLKFTPMATTGWRKILDFKNRTSDNGLYIFNSKLQFYPYPRGPDISFSPGVPVTALFTRDATTGEMNGDVNGVCNVQLQTPVMMPLSPVLAILFTFL